jgi:hypothetical protein
MTYPRSLSRFILTGLFLSAMSISTVVSAKTFLVEFQAANTTGSTASPYWPSYLLNPGDTLLDFTFDAILGDGLLRDDPGILSVFTDVGPNNQVTDFNLYDWGGSGQHGDLSPTFMQMDPFELNDFVPRDGSVDTGNPGFKFSWFAPRHDSHPGSPADQEYHLFVDAIRPDSGQDLIGVDGPSQAWAQQIRGDWVISEVPAVPVPAAIWLFGTGILGLIGFSKRKAARLKAA